MFRSQKGPALPPTTDYTTTLRETSFYRHGQLRRLGLGGELTALAVDPLLSLLAVAAGTAVHVYGDSAFQFTLPVGGAVKFLAFHPGHSRLVVVDEKNSLHSFALNNIVESTNPNVTPPLPKKEASYPLFGEITAIEQPLPSYTHMLLATRDGVTLAWDLRQATLSKFQIPNLWALREERLVRSGVPDRQKTIRGPQATCTAMNPRDLNILLIGYEGGVVAYDFRKGQIAKTFEFTLPPGAPGGGNYHEGALWIERRPAVTSVTWRPDGLVFAVGYADGCIAFWAYADADKPFMVRTLTHEDVHVPDAEAFMDAGALPSSEPQISHEFEGMPVLSARIPTAASANREPIFKLAWAGFPDQAALELLAAASEVPLTSATASYVERGETLLLVLGGQSPGEKPGINLLQFPAYTPTAPSVGLKKVALLVEGLTAAERQAFRHSITPTGTSNYRTKTPPEDFLLQPRSSPYFNMAHDAVALYVLLTPDDNLPALSEHSAQRQLEAFVFPPPRSDNPPPPLGRKTYVTPGNEDLVAMMSAPSDSAAQRVQSGQSVSSWRFPWTESTPTGSPDTSVTSLALSTAGLQEPRRHLRVPSQLWSGGLSVMGAHLISLPTPTFMRLLAHTIANEQTERVPRVPLRGGLAVPDLSSAGAPDLKVAKMQNYRVLVTWHPDCTVRFWDISPHILLLPTPLKFEYPAPLPHLTIHVGPVLSHPDVAHLPIAKLWATERAKVQVSGVHLAREALECVITFVTGEVLVAKFGDAQPFIRPDPSAPFSLAIGEDDEDADASSGGGYSPQEEWAEEVTELDQIANWSTDGFKPVALCTVRRGAVISCAVSDIGFIAIAYEQNSLAILDMRGPDVILREGFDGEGRAMKRRKRKAHPLNVAAEGSQIGAMRWTISGMGGDQSLHPRLIVSYQSGKTKVYCLNNVLGEWLVDPKPPAFQNESLAYPLATYLLDPISGSELLASPEALADVANASVPEIKWTKDAPPHCVWITACKRTIRIAVNFNGERVAKVELDEDLASAHYITRHEKRIFVAVTTAGSALVYTVPHLEFVTRLDLIFGHSRPVGGLSFDDRSGDFIEFAGPLDITLRTLFYFRKPLPPRIDPCSLKTPIPAQPTPLSSSFGWMWGAGPLTGAGLDSLISPVRAAPPQPPHPPRQPLMGANAVTWGESPKTKPDPEPKPDSNVKNQAMRKANAPQADSLEGRDTYSELREGLNRRGEALDSLGEQLDNVGKAAGEYLQAARAAVAKESAKAAGKGMFSKMW